MDIFDYIKKYGIYSFTERKFNEIDNVVFSSLAYIDFNDIASINFSNKITIEEAGKIYFEKYGDKTDKKKISSIKNAILVLKKVMNTKRYKNIPIHNYQYISDENFQFGAVSFDISDKLVYIAFEGTDHLISGWMEDFMMACVFPVKAQKCAIKYLNRFIFNNKKIILGGHSKGGHLAIISAMYTNYFIKKRILKIYSNDGLGIKDEEFNSRKYKSIKERIIKLIPDYSIVGHLLRSDTNYKIIKSTRSGLSSHNINTWVIKNNKFERSTNSKSCKILEKAINGWLSQYNVVNKLKFTESIFNICKKNDIKTIYDIKGKKRLLLKEVTSADNIDDEVKEMFKELYRTIRKCNREYRDGDLSK